MTEHTMQDLRNYVTTATMACDGEYDIDAIVQEISGTYQTLDADQLEADEFWAVVWAHQIAS
jgi:hypothetical protein